MPRDPTHDPLPENFPALEEEIEYWTRRLAEGGPDSNWAHWLNIRLRRLEHHKTRLMSQNQDQKESYTKNQRGLVFLSCGQLTPEEKALGQQVKKLIETQAKLEVYFAEDQSTLRGLTDHILGALNRCVGFVGIMHPRGNVTTPTGTFERASLWIEQEIAIAAFIEHVLNRRIEVQLYMHKGIKREGLRDKLLLNVIEFTTDAEVLEHVKASRRWNNLERAVMPLDEAFDATFQDRRQRSNSELYVLRRDVPKGTAEFRSPTYLFLFASPLNRLQIPQDEDTEREFAGLIEQHFQGHRKLMQIPGADVGWSPDAHHTSLKVVFRLHDQERCWRLSSFGEVAFITQVRWKIATNGELWSLYDLAADTVNLTSLTNSLWKKYGYQGPMRLAADLKTPGLELYRDKQGFPSMLYGLLAGSGDFLVLDATAVSASKEPRTTALAEVRFETTSLDQTYMEHTSVLVNSLLRSLGHRANVQKLRETIRGLRFVSAEETDGR